MKQEYRLQLKCAEMDDSRLQALTRDLSKSLRQNNVGTVSVPELPSEPGKKGDPVTIGNIILALIGSGGVAATLVQVLKVYVERKPSLHIELSRPDGQKLVLSTENLGESQFQATSRMVDSLLKS
jgi:hypothetical protein